MPMPVYDKDDNLHMIEIHEVTSVSKDEKTRRIMVYAKCGEYYLPSTISQIETLMVPYGFIKIDKNRIINLSQVESYNNGILQVDGLTLIVSRRNRKRLRKALGLE